MSDNTAAVSNDYLKKAWRSFVEDRFEEDDDKIRPVILSSWRRCSILNVNPWQKSVPNMLEDEELADLKRQHKELLNSSMPILYELYVSIRNAPFVITIAAPNGVILKTIGNSDALEMVRLGNYVEGANWSEASAGTNGIGTAIATGAPVQIYSYEHFCRCSQHFTCSSSPVKDSMGKLLGVITITGRDIDANDFTMGMIIASAEIIESRLLMQKMRREHRNDQLYRNALVNLVQRGILTVDSEGRIYDINSDAIHLLQLNRDINYSGKYLKEVMSKENLPLCSRICEEIILTDELITIGGGRNRRRCRMTIRPFYDVAGNRLANLVVIDEDFAPKNSKGSKVKPQVKTPIFFNNMIGESDLHRRTIALAERAAHSDSTILILGESGTVFLDEIGDMPMNMQVNLLRVIETRSIVRVGSTDEVPIDVRIIAATNKNLREEIRKGRFREDLYYRLNVISIWQPALRDRPQDIAPLTRAFYGEFCSREDLTCRGGISPDYIRALTSYSFPGNIRELRNLVERTVFLSPDGSLTTEFLPDDILGKIGKKIGQPKRQARAAESAERGKEALSGEFVETAPRGSEMDTEEALIRELLHKYKGNITKAAEEMQIARSTFYRRMRKYGVEGEEENP